MNKDLILKNFMIIHMCKIPLLILIYCLLILTICGALNLSQNIQNDDDELRISVDCGRVDVNASNVLTQVPWVVWYYFNEDVLRVTKAAVILNPYTLIGNANALLALSKIEPKYEIFPYNEYHVVIGTMHFYDHFMESDILEVSYIKPYGKFNRKPYKVWEERLQDIAIIHLKTPINLTQGLHSAICLPDNDKDISELTKQGSSVRLGGWTKNSALSYLNLTIIPDESCLKLWEGDEKLPNHYKDRVCGRPTNDEEMDCVNADGGAAIIKDGRYNFVGFTNNYFSNTTNRLCTDQSRYIFNVIQKDALEWVKANMRNGPNKFTCDNGQAIDLKGICNQIPECEDGSDEDPYYCRGLKYCHPADEFECGIYGSCINKDLVCNGIKDCENGEDEDPEIDGCSSLLSLGLGIGGGLLILSIIVTVLFLVLRKKYKNAGHFTLEEDDLFRKGDGTDSINGIPYDEIVYEIERHQLKYDQSEKLGEGAFGVVYSGTLTKMGYSRIVAVKTIKIQGNMNSVNDLTQEIKMMIYAGPHENIVNFIGACTKRRDIISGAPCLIVLEYCALGSLESYLKKYRDTYSHTHILNSPNNSNYVNLRGYTPGCTYSDLVKWSRQIADGMMHLSSPSKRIIHGDLAARNIMLDENGNAKIGDFGLSVKLYEKLYRKDIEKVAPWRWVAPECFQDYKFSTSSDIWSFGVTMWEIFTLGCVPYAFESRDVIIQSLLNGARLEKPQEASNEIYEIMKDCWNLDPMSRPSFQNLSRRISNTQYEASSIIYLTLN